jgi:SDR family mycofactocin-dependent oxidoreductase
MGRFDGKTVFITGGARGQGRSHAVAFAREGADIVVCDAVAPIDTVPYDLPTPDDLAETVRQVEDLDRRCVAEQADVRDPAAVESVVERGIAEFGKVDICLANAGIFTFSTIAEMDDTTWNTMIDVNLTGVFHTLRAVLPSMRERGSGRIIATSSMAGKMGFANVGHYVATKWGVIGLVKSLAQEVAAEGITVNAICPTGVATTMIHNDAAYRLFLPDMENPTKEDAEPAFAGLNAIPIPWVEVEDISNAMMFLASDDARYITGETLAVAAGQNATNAG